MLGYKVLITQIDAEAKNGRVFSTTSTRSAHSLPTPIPTPLQTP
jgi:hypothetical protein